MQSNIKTRHAGTQDRRVLQTFDGGTANDLLRRAAIDAAIASRHCWVAESSGRVVGYGILSRNFFNRDFIERVFVAEDARRKGAGTALLSAMEKVIRDDRVFTSAHDANAAMHALLLKQGYRQSGSIENLDRDGAEQVFVKFLER
jgi:GNAT superfamily N-acetyltransferase